MSHAERNLEEVKKEIKEKEKRKYELLDKEVLTKREEEELKDIRNLEADKKFWMDRIPKGILLLK